MLQNAALQRSDALESLQPQQRTLLSLHRQHAFLRIFRDLVISLGGVGTINHIINSTGGPVNSSTQTAYLVSYP